MASTDSAKSFQLFGVYVGEICGKLCKVRNLEIKPPSADQTCLLHCKQPHGLFKGKLFAEHNSTTQHALGLNSVAVAKVVADVMDFVDNLVMVLLWLSWSSFPRPDLLVKQHVGQK